jgi:hypothetical protein
MDSRGIREALLQRPFIPFQMRLADGRELTVRHPEYVAVSARNILFINDQDEAITWIEPLLVVTLDFTKSSQESKPSNGTSN